MLQSQSTRIGISERRRNTNVSLLCLDLAKAKDSRIFTALLEPSICWELSRAQDHSTLVAIYDFKARSSEELTLKKGDLMVCLLDVDGWFYVKKTKTQKGWVPKNVVTKKGNKEQFDWFKRINRADAERFLENEANASGVFLITESESKPGMLSLSIKRFKQKVVHYTIIKTKSELYYLKINKRCFATLEELVNHHKGNADGLCCKLTTACKIEVPLIPVDFREKNWEIPRNSLTIMEPLGEGNFGKVHKGKYNKVLDVAVKILKQGTMHPQSFLAEAEIMKRFAHENLVKLFAVCTLQEPILIVTEYMPNGSLLKYLQDPNKRIRKALLIDFASQVALGMDYLEKNKYVHRDLAARNVLVGENNIVKVSDFGMARLLLNGEYYSRNPGSQFPVKWTAPEALSDYTFTTKSDVWSFGILLIEIITCGHEPYPGMSNDEVMNQLKRQYRHPKPEGCPTPLYGIMEKCWHKEPDKRPAFQKIYDLLRILKNDLR